MENETISDLRDELASILHRKQHEENDRRWNMDGGYIPPRNDHGLSQYNGMRPNVRKLMKVAEKMRNGEMKPPYVKNRKNL